MEYILSLPGYIPPHLHRLTGVVIISSFDKQPYIVYKHVTGIRAGLSSLDMYEATMEERSKAVYERLKILDICCQVEEQCSELYRYLAEIHCKDRDVAQFWCLTAIDEDNHVCLFKMASRLKGVGIIELFITAESASEMLNNMKTLLKNVRNKPPSVLTALRYTIRMEKNLSKIHLGHIANFSDERTKKLFSSTLIKNQDRIKQLEKAIAERMAQGL